MKLLLHKAPQISDSALELPSQFFTREGVKVEITGDRWTFPLLYRHSKLDFSRVENDTLKTSIKRCIIDQASRVSTHAGCQYWSDISAAIVSRQKKHSLLPDISADEFQERLIAVMEEAISQARNKHRLWALYRPIQWYIWCAENYPENGFSDAYAAELEAMVIPGGPKGEAVRMSDPDTGPLHKSLELPLLVAALNTDQSEEFEHLQQKAVMALSLAFGRNPANLTYLRESDLIKLDPANEDPCFMVRMPRIKKRHLNPRDDLLDEYLDPKFGRVIEALIEQNRTIKLDFDGRIYSAPEERPILIMQRGNGVAIRARDGDNIFNLTSSDIARLLSAFVKRHNIISPLTGELMRVTPRRLRYTLATGLAAEGISKRELARILDHTDTQHVNVYFEMAGKIVEHLDKATAKGFSKYLSFFKGRLIDSDEDAVNGERDDKHLTFVDDQNPVDQADIGICGESSVCHLDPPYSCYLCPKFQPYRHADHEYVLECLLVGREERLKRYENARLGIQLDEVIAAVAQVAKLCEKGAHNV